MGLFVRAISGVLVLALACAGPADAGRSAGAGAAPGIADLKRAVARAERDAAAAGQSVAQAERTVAEAQARLADLDARAHFVSAHADDLHTAAAAAETAAARALASLSLAARGGAPPPHPALASLAGRLGSAAATARNEADRASAAAVALDLERRVAIADLEQAGAKLQATDETRRSAAIRLSTLKSQVQIAERAEAERRLADARARKNLAQKKSENVRTAAANARGVAMSGTTDRFDWMIPVQGGSARFGAAGGALTIAARAGSEVLAPINGEITYAGLFRTYGQVLILSGSDGYAFVLSGMDRIYGTTGQFVRRGERIGALPVRDSAELGLELRKNGVPVAADRWAKDEIKPRRGGNVEQRRMTASLEKRPVSIGGEP